MCGIVGYVGKEQAAPILLNGLAKLEYRGYDSAGLAVRDGESPVEVVKAKGRLKALEEKTNNGLAIKGTCGIGHTRWATHGEPSENNAHPHISDDYNVVGVHNGIIENYQELRDKLVKNGYEFYSSTDTEVAIKLIDYYYKKYEHTPVDAINHAMVRIRGSYAFAIMFKEYPDEIYVARKDSPMILGVSDGNCYVGSDVPAILNYTRNVYYIGNMEIGRLADGNITFYNLDGDEIEKELVEIKWDAKAAEKGGYEHFMMKEIHEQPKAIADTLNSVLKDGKLDLSAVDLSDEEIKKLIEDTEHLKKYQEEPSSDEDLRKLPMLTRADMKKNAMPFSNIEDELLDVKVVRHDIESNGIDYISFLFDAGDFAQSELGYLGFFTNALGLVSTEKYSYTDLANATNIYTGGISTGTASHPDIKDRNNFVFKLEVKLKVLEKNLDKALELMEQMLLSSDFTDTKRLGELVAQIKARLQANLSSSGHLVAAMRSMSSFSRYALYQDELKGVAFYRSICRIEKELSESPKNVSDKLAAIAKKLFARNRMLISFTGNNEAYGNAKPSLEKVIAGFDKMSAIGNQAEVHFNTAKAGMMILYARTLITVKS